MKNNKNSSKTAKLVIFAENELYREKAEFLSKKLNIKTVDEMPSAQSGILSLKLSDNGLSLTGNGQTLQCDFTKMIPRIKPNNLNSELLVKAAKVKGIKGTPTVVDATAGFGEDSFLLAAAGFEVKLFEKDAVIAALLEDALCRAEEISDIAEIAKRMKLFESDSVDAMPKMQPPADVIYLDPMFPARQKSALIKKKFQLLQQLERPCSDEEDLLNAAIRSNPRKIVIKRPLKAEFLAGQKPSYSIKGKSIRYDCIVI